MTSAQSEFSPAFSTAFDAEVLAQFGICAWPVDTACLTAEWEAMPEDVQIRSVALASATLRRLTGYRVGNCPITVRPCKRSCAQEYGSFYGGTFTPHINLDGNWVNGCGCSTDCSCGPICEVRLPGPVTEVAEVNVGGTVITDVKVQGNNLVYTGTDDCPFPSCQNLAAAVGEPDTFSVTYYNSYRPDGMAAYAAGIMAVEYGKACTGSKCRLPAGTTSVTRQGLSIEIAGGSFPGGVTGIREVDAFIGLWRPAQPPRVWSPRGAGQTRIERS
jgi:hypothetical protein